MSETNRGNDLKIFNTTGGPRVMADIFEYIPIICTILFAAGIVGAILYERARSGSYNDDAPKKTQSTGSSKAAQQQVTVPQAGSSAKDPGHKTAKKKNAAKGTAGTSSSSSSSKGKKAKVKKGSQNASKKVKKESTGESLGGDNNDNAPKSSSTTKPSQS